MRINEQWKYVFLSFTLILSLGITGCTKEDTSEIKERKVIIVGCDDYAPFNYLDVNGEMTGIDVDLARAAFSKIGYDVVFQFINWEEKKELLEKNEVDCLWSSFTMTGREAEYKWAGPYMKSNQVIAVNDDSPITSLADLDGKTVAVQTSTKPEDLFRMHAENMPALKKVISVSDRDLIFTFLSKGYVDAIAAHDTSIEQFMYDFDISYRILDEPLLSVDLGVAFDLNDSRQIDVKLSKVVNQMKKDGTIKKILSKYLSDPEKYVEEQ